VDKNNVRKPGAWHTFKACESDRELVFGPVVPHGEYWVLTHMAAKVNDPGTWCAEINVAVCTDEGEWLCIASLADRPGYNAAQWSGEILMGPGWQLGAWFRNAHLGRTLQVDATWYVIGKSSWWPF